MFGKGGGGFGGDHYGSNDAPQVQGSRIVDRYQAPRWLQQGRLELVAALRSIRPNGPQTLQYHCTVLEVDHIWMNRE